MGQATAPFQFLEATIDSIHSAYKSGQLTRGGARRPDKKEIRRLNAVAKYYNTRSVVLAEWVKGKHCRFYWLIRPQAEPKRAWGEVDPGVVFR